MPDSFDSSGLQVKNLNTLIADLTAALQTIYGSDINVDPNSPDGQMIGIFAQAGVDLREVLVNINAGFDPDQAEGITLDQRAKIVGIKRNIGTFTTVTIDVVTSSALSLVGLDGQAGIINPSVANLYIVKDDAGTQWYLLASQSPGGAGTHSYAFQAAKLGATLVTANTITTPVTIVAGVTSVNNPAGALALGTDEESDAGERTRFHRSTAIQSQGFIDGLEALLRNLSTVASAFVYDNDEAFSDGFGTPANTIWCIVDGGSPTDIAAAIIAKKAGGAGMRGAQTHAVTLANGQTFTAKWDIPNPVNLYIKFSVNLPGGGVDRTGMKTLIEAGLFWGVGEDAVGDVVTGFVRDLNPKYRVTGMLLSLDGSTWVEIVVSASPVNRFENAAVRMAISS